jgi:hypothetical protein
MSNYDDDDAVGEFSFSYEDSEGTLTKKTFRADTWLEAIEQFKYFLSGCGFLLNRDSITINHSIPDTSTFNFT